MSDRISLVWPKHPGKLRDILARLLYDHDESIDRYHVMAEAVEAFLEPDKEVLLAALDWRVAPTDPKLQKALTKAVDQWIKARKWK